MSRTGVFICHCGGNIAATVEVARVAQEAASLPGVALAVEHEYLCSEAGQRLIKEAIAQRGLDRVVIGACSPRLHEHTFRHLLATTQLNPYLLEIANLREQCAWVHADKQQGTVKAVDLVKMAVAKAARAKPLNPVAIPVHKKALVVGGGISGIQAALDIAEAGYPVTIVERQPSLGGKMAALDKTFPSMECSACVLAPQMAAAGRHPLITLMTYSELDSVCGQIGNFQVTIRRKAAYVDHNRCTGCGLCENACPVRMPSEFEQGLGERAAIYRMFKQAVPPKPVIDAAHCRMLREGRCSLCRDICPQGCINYADADKLVTDTYGAIVLATGYEPLEWGRCYGEYGGGRYANIISGLQFERLACPAGPTAGRLTRPSDGAVPKKVVIISCVGSRDPHKGKSYCSRACCMSAAKHARQVVENIAGARCHVFYTDIRAFGKGHEEFCQRVRATGVDYIRGRVAKIYPEDGKLICKGEDTLLGRPLSVVADLVVLETAMVPPAGLPELAAMLGLSLDASGWLAEAHPKLKPVETHSGGIFVAGAAQGPKDITDSVAQAGAAAAKVCALFSKDELQVEALIAHVEQDKCCGCGDCARICPYQAIVMAEPASAPRRVAEINPALCRGCGVCVAACRSASIDMAGFSQRQLWEEVDALCW